MSRPLNSQTLDVIDYIQSSSKSAYRHTKIFNDVSAEEYVRKLYNNISNEYMARAGLFKNEYDYERCQNFPVTQEIKNTPLTDLNKFDFDTYQDPEALARAMGLPSTQTAFVPSKFQTLLLESYPDIDLLAIDPKNPAEVDIAVRNHTTGDGMFGFIWNELSDAESYDEANERIERAQNDLIAVAHRLAHAEVHGDKPASLVSEKRATPPAP